ncbi:heat-inducible transcriptional repressor HrcA [soil metagenome]
MTELNLRARQILYAVISEFVATGEPVGSRTISKKAGIDLSPASIRNVLSDLEELGYLAQPHTSAGRIPTERAFRLFVDALMEIRQLSIEEHAHIRDYLEAVEPGKDVLRETGKLLSELTGTAAVVVTPKGEGTMLRSVRFVSLGPEELLAVLVMKNGTVANRFLQTKHTQDELVRIHNLLDDVIEGRSLKDVRELFARRLTGERVQYDELRRRAFELGTAAIADVPIAPESQIVIEGHAKLFEQPEFSDAHNLKSVMSALDERDRLVALLDATMAAEAARVVVGSEAGGLGGGQLAIVGASFTQDGQRVGTVGIIGPTRMDYPKIIPIVTATANAMTTLSDQGKRDPGKND